MSDALEIFRAARAQPPKPMSFQASGYQVNTMGGDRDLHGLAMVPGSPGYNARIPKPPCTACGEDHFAGREYDHEWQAEMVHDEPVSATVRRVASAVTVDAAAATATAQYRVGLYVGRGDTYVISVENAPDWDASVTFKVEQDRVLQLIWLARALNVKIADKTGGDLMMLEQDYARQYEEANGRGPTGLGDSGSRRPGPGANGPEKGLEPGGAPPPDRDAV